MTLRKSALAGLVVLAACQQQQDWQDATIADRLARFEAECGFSVSLPSSEREMATLFGERGVQSYLQEAPSTGPSGDNVFPLEKTPEHDHAAIVRAIVAICPLDGNPQALGARSPRFAFYVDDAGVVFHVEDRSLYLG